MISLLFPTSADGRRQRFSGYHKQMISTCELALYIALSQNPEQKSAEVRSLDTKLYVDIEPKSESTSAAAKTTAASALTPKVKSKKQTHGDRV